MEHKKEDSMTLCPLTPAIGAVVGGIDLSLPLSSGRAVEIKNVNESLSRSSEESAGLFAGAPFPPSFIFRKSARFDSRSAHSIRQELWQFTRSSFFSSSRTTQRAYCIQVQRKQSRWQWCVAPGYVVWQTPGHGMYSAGCTYSAGWWRHMLVIDDGGVQWPLRTLPEIYWWPDRYKRFFETISLGKMGSRERGERASYDTGKRTSAY